MIRDTATYELEKRYSWHEAQWATLSGQLDRLPHALLLSGQRGLGKHDFAVQFSQLLLCTQPRDGVACGQCQSCRLFKAGTHPDWHVLQPEAVADSRPGISSLYAVRYPASEKKRERPSGEITIYQVRSLNADIQVRPYLAGRKVVLLSPAEAMNINSANSLLKLLEEPPRGSVLLLVANNVVRLPATIRSRCNPLLFKSPPLDQGLAWLESRGETPTEMADLLKMTGGAPLLAEELAEEDFPQHRNELLKDLAALRLSRLEPVQCAARWKALGTVRSLAWLHGYVSDLIKSQMGGAISELTNSESERHLKNENNKYEIKDLFSYIDRIHEYHRLLGGPLDELLILEDLLIGWCRLSRLQ